ncbi:flagellar protein FliT [Lysinibacillus telephonicus]|uniref:flagellar protein FliT n=1 Tax=Lysinibacillus telephonicus TaxID=1714840 RepID=UPI0039793CB0
MDLTTQLLQVSAKLFKHLTTIPNGNERTTFIEEINNLLDERGQLVEQLKLEGFHYDESIKTHVTLFELDKGIQERLNLVLNEVKTDIKNLNNSKKHEMQYINPYSSVRVMDGRYYDKKK